MKLDQAMKLTVEESVTRDGRKMKYTEMKGVGHWMPQQDDDATWDWLFAQRKSDAR